MKGFFRRLFREPVSLIVASAAIALLVVHMLRPDEFRIDSITLGLLAIILISPYLRFITRIRFGQLAVDIDRRQVEELESKARAVPEAGEKLTDRRITHLLEMLTQIAEYDSSLAVIRLSIEVENRLRRLVELEGVSERGEPPSRAGIRQLSKFLLKKKAIDEIVFDAISVLADIRNKVVHGGRVEEAHAMRMLESGMSLIYHLESLLEEKISKSIESQKITKEEAEEASGALYKITTIVPYVEEPEKQTYILTREELDNFLEGYEEYAEFIVSVEKVEKAKELEAE